MINYVARGNSLFKVKEVLKGGSKKRGTIVKVYGMLKPFILNKSDKVFSRKPSSIADLWVR